MNTIYEPAGIVHRGEFFSPCGCGGIVNAYWDGEFISHSEGFNPRIEHVATYFQVKIRPNGEPDDHNH